MSQANRMVIKEKQYKQLYLCLLHYYSWFLVFRLGFHQSLAFWLAANTFLKESPFPSPSMPGLHICCLHRTDALLWIMFSLLPCLSPFFWPHSGAWFPPFSREDLFLPTTFPSISLSIQIDLRVSALCCRVKMCSPSKVCELWFFQSRAIPDHLQRVICRSKMFLLDYTLYGDYIEKRADSFLCITLL